VAAGGACAAGDKATGDKANCLFCACQDLVDAFDQTSWGGLQPAKLAIHNSGS